MRSYERVIEDQIQFAAGTASEKVSAFGTSEVSVLSAGRLPDGAVAKIVGISISPMQESVMTGAKAEDVMIFLSEAGFETYVSEMRWGGGPVKYFPAGGIAGLAGADAVDNYFVTNGVDARRLMAEIPVGINDVLRLDFTGPATNLTAILKVKVALHCLVTEKGKGEA